MYENSFADTHLSVEVWLVGIACWEIRREKHWSDLN